MTGRSIANRPPTPIRVIASTHQLYEDVNINCTLDILFTSQWVRRCPQNCFFSRGIWAAIQGQGHSIMFGGGLSPGHGESKPIKGVWGRAPTRAQGLCPWSGCKAPLKLKTFQLLDAQRKQQICLILSEP